MVSFFWQLMVFALKYFLRFVSNSWQVISPVEVCGFVTSVNELITIQNKVYQKPTVIIATRVTGEEEIPDGVVAVLTSDMPDVLSHVSIRARNSKACVFWIAYHNFYLSHCQQKVNIFTIYESSKLPKVLSLRKPTYIIYLLENGADMLCHMLRSKYFQESQGEGGTCCNHTTEVLKFDSQARCRIIVWSVIFYTSSPIF